MRKRKNKTHFIKKKSVFNQVKKNESALERIKGYQGEIQIHPGKMEVCQIEKKMQLSTIKFRKKIKEEKEKKRKPSQAENSKWWFRQKLEQKKKKNREPSGLKTRKGGLGKIRAKSKQKKIKKIKKIFHKKKRVSDLATRQDAKKTKKRKSSRQKNQDQMKGINEDQ